MSKKHAKIGGRQGKPAYRTPSSFKYKQAQKINKQRIKKSNKK